jgi:hypothetical protein
MRWMCHLSFVAGCAIMALPSCANAANQYAFVSPTPGAVVVPGQRLEVIIQGPPAKAILVGGITWAGDRVIAPPLYKYYISVPYNAPAGPVDITAMIHPEIGSMETIAVGVAVQPSLVDANLVLSPQEHVFTFFGQTRKVSAKVVNRTTGVGSDLGDVGGDLTVTPNDGSIVLFERPGGNVVAAQSGSTYVTFQYKGLTSLLLIDVEPSAIRGDLNGDGRVDQLDINIVQGRIGLPKVVPNDSRDINLDGKIDALDLRVLTSMCSKPRCAI